MAEHSLEALFRYQLVSEVVARMESGELRAEAVRATATSRKHFALDGSVRRVSTRTLYRWLAAYHRAGIGGLEPDRPKRGPSPKTLPRPFVAFLIGQKKVDADASIPELIRRAKEAGVLEREACLNRSTVYRTCRRLGLPVARRKKNRASRRDARRFAYPHRMDMMLADGKHFRAGAGRRKRVAFFFIDDATRYLLHVVVGTSENAALFQRGLYETVCRYGRSSIVYLDQGPGFIEGGTLEAIRRLPSVLIHGETAYPEGHGKIEKFNQTAKSDLLRGLDGRADVDADCRALELRLQHYASKIYNVRPHESLQRRTPFECFHTDERPLRMPESRAALRRCFEIHLWRRVSHDRVVSVDSIFYEMPRGYVGQNVIVRKRLLEGTLHFVHEGRLIELHRVDLAANARARRGKEQRRRGAQDEIVHPLPPSAADLAFERDFGPIVGPDGGFSDPHEEESP